jgi:hypothetical protein
MVEYYVYLRAEVEDPTDIFLYSGAAPGYTYKDVFETGVGSEAIGLAASIPPTDAGVGADVVATLSVEVPLAETGQGTDEPLITHSPSLVDSGVGVDAAAMEGHPSPNDSGAGVETLAVNAGTGVSEVGASTEAIALQGQASITDSAAGVESESLAVAIPVSETGAASDSPSVEAAISLSDALSGVDTPTIAYSLGTVSDNGLGTENITTPGTLAVTDEGKGAEFAWRTKPSSPMIDDLALPHVLSIIIPDVASISDKKVQGGSLPRRKMVGKEGRNVTIEGWTDEQSEIDALEALMNGVPRTFYHPSGDSFAVLVTAFNPSLRVDEFDRRIYSLTLAEK